MRWPKHIEAYVPYTSLSISCYKKFLKKVEHYSCFIKLPPQVGRQNLNVILIEGLNGGV